MTVDEWVTEHMPEISEAMAFAVDDLPYEPAKLGQHLGIATALYPRMGALLADAEAFVLKAHAASVMETRRAHGDLTADERKVLAKADPDYLRVLKLRDDLAVIVAALKNKSFAIMNHRNNACDPKVQSDD